MDGRVGDRGGGQDEGGVGAVAGADPAQPAQHHREVRTEDAPVDVALVDDDVAQRPEERRPVLVPRQEGVMEQVGVGEDVVRVLPDPPPVVGRGVAVVGGRAQPGQGQPVEPVQLVVGQGLGRRQVQRGRAPPVRRQGTVHDVGERRQQVPQGLARRRPGRQHDVDAGVGRLGRLELVAPEARQPRLGECGVQRGRDPLRPRCRRCLPRGDPVDVGEPLLPSARQVRQQRLGGGAGCSSASTHRRARRRSREERWNGSGHRRYGTSA